MQIRILSAFIVAVFWVLIVVWYANLRADRDMSAYENTERVKAEALIEFLTKNIRDRLSAHRAASFIVAGRSQIRDALPFVEYTVIDDHNDTSAKDRLAVLFADTELRQISDSLKSIANRLRVKSIKLLHLSGEVVASSLGHDINGGLSQNLRRQQFFQKLRRPEINQNIVISDEGDVIFQFASPVLVDDQLMGAILIEQPAQAMSDIISAQDDLVVVTDALGMVVLSEEPEFLSRAVPGTFAASMNEAQLLARYNVSSLDSLDLELEAVAESGNHIDIHEGGEAYSHLTAKVRPDTLRLHVLAPLEQLHEIQDEIYQESILAGIIGLLIILGLERSLAFGQTLQRQNTELAAANETVTRAMSERSHFFARMSHEIRTPMTGVLGMLEQVGLTKLDREQAGMVDAVRQSAESLVVIINDILDMSKIEAGKLAIEAVEVDVSDLVEQVAISMAPLCQQKGITITCCVDPNIRSGYFTDPVRLKQIINNFTTNSVKFTENGGVHLQAAILSKGVGVDRIELSVSDTGIGMDAETLSRLFKPFEQAESSTTRRFGGTGLGLSICQSLAEMMDGELSVSSTPGEGSVFKITFDLARVPHFELENPPADFLDGKNLFLHIEVDRVRECVTEYAEAAGATLVTDRDGADLQITEVIDPTAPPEDRTLYLSAAAGGYEEGRNMVSFLQRRSLIAKIGRLLGLDPQGFEVDHGARSGALHRVPSHQEAVENGALILVADDHPVNRQVLTRHLNSLGYAVSGYEDGRQALDGYRAGSFGLVLTDINMPYMSGVDLAEVIRADEEKAGAGTRVPILAITASIVPEESLACAKAGVDEVLLKPIVREKLGEAIGKWLPGKATEVLSDDEPEEYPAIETEAAANQFLDIPSMVEMLGSDPAFLNDIMRDFVSSTSSDLGNLKQGRKDGDAQAVYQSSHRITGACNMIGAITTGARSLEVETVALKGDISSSGQKIDALIGQVEELFQFLDTTDMATLLDEASV